MCCLLETTFCESVYVYQKGATERVCVSLYIERVCVSLYRERVSLSLYRESVCLSLYRERVLVIGT